MSLQEEVIKIGKKLDKMVSSDTTDHSSAVELLNTLKKQRMTLVVLKKTRIGMTVNNFRKACQDDQAVALSKSLIKGWKKLLSADESSQNSSSMNKSNSTASVAESVSSTGSGKETESQQEDDEGSNNGAEGGGSPSESEERKEMPETPTTPTSPSMDAFRQATFPVSASDTADAVRIKCRQLLGTALTVETPPENSMDPEMLGAMIEDAIYQEYKETSMKYKTRVRSRIANLKDAKNPKLREGVLIGHVPPNMIAKMTAEEMASDDLKKARAKFTKESINDHQMAVTSGTKSSLLKCGKCQQRNCTYNQVQTRSADEPMTTFCFCMSCGNRWKFC